MPAPLMDSGRKKITNTSKCHNFNRSCFFLNKHLLLHKNLARIISVYSKSHMLRMSLCIFQCCYYICATELSLFDIMNNSFSFFILTMRKNALHRELWSTRPQSPEKAKDRPESQETEQCLHIKECSWCVFVWMINMCVCVIARNIKQSNGNH